MEIGLKMDPWSWHTPSKIPISSQQIHPPPLPPTPELASYSWRPLDWTTLHNRLMSRQFHSLVPWWHRRRIPPQKTHLKSIGKLDSVMDTWQILKNASLVFKKWHEIKFRCVDVMEPSNSNKSYIIWNKWCFINSNMEFHNWELWSPMI